MSKGSRKERRREEGGRKEGRREGGGREEGGRREEEGGEGRVTMWES